MSLLHCKKVYDPEGNAAELQQLPLRELRKIPGITICEGFVIEASWTLNVNKPTVELMCVHCGRRTYCETRKYIKLLDALKIDYSGRLP